MQIKARLLIVDDDEDMLETLSDILHEKGYKIETANTGRKAITKARERFFDIALVDINLPDMTGIEVLRTFRKKRPAMMNIMITGRATRQNAVDALNLGASAYIMKPVDPATLEQMIKKCLASARARLL